MANKKNWLTCLDDLCLIMYQGISFLNLTGAFCIYIVSGFMFLWYSCGCEHVNMFVFVYLLLFKFFINSLDACFFPKEKHKGDRSRRRAGREELGEDMQGENRIYVMKNLLLIKLKEKSQKNVSNICKNGWNPTINYLSPILLLLL